MAPVPFQLTGEQLSTFVTHGVLILQSDLPDSFHEEICAQLTARSATGNFGNNLIPEFPIFRKLLESTTVRGAVSSVLGEDYLVQPHRHGHTASKERFAGGWHKDSYWGTWKVRRHRPWMCMIMYFPQDTPLDLGPTMVSPGSQYLAESPIQDKPWNSPGKAPYVGHRQHLPAGSLLLIDYHMWHSGSAHIADRSRFMLKFQFSRQTCPAPRALTPFRPPADRPMHDLALLWGRNWAFLHGQDGVADIGLLPQDPRPNDALVADLSAEDEATRLHAIHALAAKREDSADLANALFARVSDSSEALGLEAAYALGRLPQHGVPLLLSAIAGEDERLARQAAYGLTAADATAIPALAKVLSSSPSTQARQYAAATLADLPVAADSPAQATLIAATTDAEVTVRRHAVEALGLLGHGTPATIQALAKALHDEDAQTRFTSSIALSRLAPQSAATAAIPELVAGLDDENRYVRAYNVEALLRIPDPEATRQACQYLSYMRWCPVTQNGSHF